MMKKLWTYTGDHQGSFVSKNPDYTSRLYFPLMNEAGLRSSITPELKGDINGGFDRYLMPPLVTEELHRTLNARYVWLKSEDRPGWNINGLSPGQQTKKWTDQRESAEVQARPGLFSLTRTQNETGLKVTIDIFVPANNDQVELWKVTVENTAPENAKFTPFLAVPLYARHADNLRDHRQVTSMFQKTKRDLAGVSVRPTIVHDEAGHHVNQTTYFAFFHDQDAGLPERIWTRMQDFIGEGGSLNNPAAVAMNQKEPDLKADERDGVEAIAAVAFKEQQLAPGEKRVFTAVIGLTLSEETQEIAQRYQTVKQIDQALDNTLEYWKEITGKVRIESGNPDFDEWINWLAFQLKARQIFGNSFLPDFGYGRGGRGWRDLWQDLLSIFLVDPDSAKEEIVNNLKGIRIDGSNATIIGDQPGEFKADRNNIARSWCDHGAWPLFALNFYIQQSGDLEVLFRKIPWWKDQFIFRSKQIDQEWSLENGSWQLDKQGNVLKSSVLEHVLVQQLSAFFHVGEHNLLLLEGADWNDTLDMARERGESACFESFYAGNLNVLISLLGKIAETGLLKVQLQRETLILLDRTSGQVPVDYEQMEEKRKLLDHYFEETRHQVSGESVAIEIEHLISDLRSKEFHSSNKIRTGEWIGTDSSGYFNGHYNNRGEAMHGEYPDGWRMDLTSQVIPVMFGVASEDQIPLIYQSARAHLGDNNSPGLRLCTPYPDLDLDIGRLTGFSYGFKEHGSKWMQQNIMFMYGLYSRGFSHLGEELLLDVFKLTHDESQGKTFPGIPSYYEPGDRGAYMYLTGSSTWLYLTLVTQVFGVRGDQGDLLIEPKIPGWLFKKNGQASIDFDFQNHRYQVIFNNPKKLSPEKWAIKKVTIDEVPYSSGVGEKRLLVNEIILRSFERDQTRIVIDLG